MHESHDQLLNNSRQAAAASTSSQPDADDPCNATQVGVDYLLTASEVCSILGRSRTSLYRDVESGLIPAPVKIGSSSRWPASEIRALVQKAKAARDAEAG